tara:strand:- start:157 stop:786 length:630 start_codon:yes stop_codon:yes gene_type:complete
MNIKKYNTGVDTLKMKKKKPYNKGGKVQYYTHGGKALSKAKKDIKEKMERTKFDEARIKKYLESPEAKEFYKNKRYWADKEKKEKKSLEKKSLKRYKDLYMVKDSFMKGGKVQYYKDGGKVLARVGVSGFNKPKKTPSHKTKSHVVVAKEGNKVKTIRFGQQGVSTAGEPKAGESKKQKMRRKSFKARHGKNISKGKMSAAYWADKVKW